MERRGYGERAATELEDMAGLRDLLVHRYGEVDNRRVLERIGQNLKDVEEFENEMERFIEEE